MSPTPAYALKDEFIIIGFYIFVKYQMHPPPLPECLPLAVVVVGGAGLAILNDLTGYAGGNFMFLVGPHKPDRP